MSNHLILANNMAYLTKQQVIEIIKNAPSGTNPVGIVAALRQEGHQLEGYDEEKPTGEKLKETKEKKTLIEKVGNFLGLEPLGKGLGLAAFKYLSPEGRELEKKVSQGTATQEELKAYSDIFGKTPTAKQVLSSATQAGILAGTAGLGIPKTILGKTIQAGAISAGFGGTQAFGEEKKPAEIAKQATISGLVGGATAGGLALAGKGIGKLVSKLPETSWSSILKRTPTSVAKNPKLETQIAKEGIVGLNREKISQTFGKEIQNIELNIADELSGKKQSILVKPIIERLSRLKMTYENIPGEQNSVTAIDKIIQEVSKKGNAMGVQAANELKRDIYNIVAKSYGKGLLEIPAKTEAQKILAYGLKKEIEKVVPEIKNLNARQAIFIQAKRAIDQTIARQTGKGIAGTGIGILDLMAGGISSLSYGASGMIGGILVKKGVESPVTSSIVSAGATKLINLFNAVSPTQKLMFYSALRGFISEGVK